MSLPPSRGNHTRRGVLRRPTASRWRRPRSLLKLRPARRRRGNLDSMSRRSVVHTLALVAAAACAWCVSARLRNSIILRGCCCCCCARSLARSLFLLAVLGAKSFLLIFPPLFLLSPPLRLLFLPQPLLCPEVTRSGQRVIHIIAVTLLLLLPPSSQLLMLFTSTTCPVLLPPGITFLLNADSLFPRPLIRYRVSSSVVTKEEERFIAFDERTHSPVIIQTIYGPARSLAVAPPFGPIRIHLARSSSSTI